MGFHPADSLPVIDCSSATIASCTHSGTPPRADAGGGDGEIVADLMLGRDPGLV